MKGRNGRHLRCKNHDIHLLPVEFLFLDPGTYRQYGSRILLFNMNNAATKEAFKSARETRSGYVCLNENVPLSVLEGVYNLDQSHWEQFYPPVTAPRLQPEQGIELASHILQYFQKLNVTRDQLLMICLKLCERF